MIPKEIVERVLNTHLRKAEADLNGYKKSFVEHVPNSTREEFGALAINHTQARVQAIEDIRREIEQLSGQPLTIERALQLRRQTPIPSETTRQNPA